ncbi:MAG: M15 family metallopeptidase [Clostridiales bacterium]|nr:M15 family metallopeptidase [Clostridiales bacterium]
MRINSNKKIHKIKRDPYKTLLRTTGILAIVVVLGIGIFYLCSMAVTHDYTTQRDNLEKTNAEAEVEFNAKMNALKSNQNATIDPDTGEISEEDLPFWENTLEGKVWRIEDEGSAGLENTGTISLNRADLVTGGMMLVNAWHSLPSDFSDSAMISVGETSNYKVQVKDASVKLYPVAYNALLNIVTDAEAAGYKHYIVHAGYRTNAEQTELFEAKMQKLSEKYTGETLIEQTKKDVNYPGTSEYQTGLSFQMGLYDKENTGEVDSKKGFQESDQGIWFTDNCWKYGVVFRFPVADFPNSTWEDKSYKTAVSTKLNLYRYVGKAHSAAMRVMDYCLEEYVEFLMLHPHICIYEDGALKYEIVRIGMADSLDSFSLPVPNPASDYQASIDNMGGIVMAYTYN